MKITNLSTLIVAADTDPIIKLFEDLGFSQEHHKEFDSENGTVNSNVLKDADGNMISLGKAPVQQTITAVRMNVDNFDEACTLLKEHGFTMMNDRAEETGTSKAALLVSPMGFAISLTEHIKK